LRVHFLLLLLLSSEFTSLKYLPFGGVIDSADFARQTRGRRFRGAECGAECVAAPRQAARDESGTLREKTSAINIYGFLFVVHTLIFPEFYVTIFCVASICFCIRSVRSPFDIRDF
jgi:hypothetical protein